MKHNNCQQPLHFLQHLFISGLIFLLPITITVSLFSILFSMIKKWLIPLKQIHIPFVDQIPHYEILLLIVFIFIIGLVMKAFILKPIVHILEESFTKVPFVGTIYKGTRQLVHAFTSHDQASFQKVVIVQYPRPGVYSIGFLTKNIPAQITNKDLCGVYIPHTPNPASGNFIMVPLSEVTEIDLTRQEATALVISGGIVQPNRFTKEQNPK